MWGRWVIRTLLAASLATPLASASETSAPTKTDIDRWVAELNDRDFAVREAAMKSLAKAGIGALPALLKAAQGKSPEARVRATQVLAAWYQRPDKQTVDAVEDAFEQLLDSAGTVGDQASTAWNAQQSARDERCLAHLERLGARIRYREDSFGIDRDGLMAQRKPVMHIAITPKWAGGDEGLKYIRRFGQRLNYPFTIYRVNGNNASDAAFQQLEDRGFRVEKRGAKLGVGNGGFDPMPLNIPGFRIGSMEENSAAEKAGLQIDDVIVLFGQKEVTNFNDLVDYLLETRPGDKVAVTVLREKQGELVRQQVAVELGDW